MFCRTQRLVACGWLFASNWQNRILGWRRFRRRPSAGVLVLGGGIRQPAQHSGQSGHPHESSHRHPSESEARHDFPASRRHPCQLTRRTLPILWTHPLGNRAGILGIPAKRLYPGFLAHRRSGHWNIGRLPVSKSHYFLVFGSNGLTPAEVVTCSRQALSRRWKTLSSAAVNSVQRERASHASLEEVSGR